MSLTVARNASIPIWAESLSGNTSDKKSFHDTIEKVRPQQNAKKDIDGFQIEFLNVTFYQKKFETQLNTKGRFIIATNEIHETEVTDEITLNEYKS